jgi:imidazolonepropionase-like amidohydrolase
MNRPLRTGTRPPVTASLSLLATALVATSTMQAQIGREGVDRAVPATYAITNARIVTAAPNGAPVIESGTVLIRDGIIRAVGPSARTTVPADARLIDGAGLTVYPGFIDAYSHVGIPAARREQSGGGSGGSGGAALASAQRGGQGAAAPNSRYPAGLQPELLAADLLRMEERPLENERGAGFTTALSVPREGVFLGRSALLNLTGDDVQDALVRSPVALHVGFTPLRGGTYPGSLMGVFAALRQMLLDAQRYARLEEAYERSPRGARRPEHDESLEALLPALRREMPVVMLASTQREIERALDLGKEFGLRVVIAGGNEAYKVADRLAAERVPVIVTLNFPRKPAGGSEDQEPEPLRVLRERAETPRNPGRLAQAGVRFGFASVGMNDLSDVSSNLRMAVENGLTKDRAVRALTVDAAQLLGVADRMGSVETGKIANLTVVRGDIFESGARVTQVFVDGRPIEVRQPAPSAPSGVAGQWNVTVTLEGRERAITLRLTPEGDRLRGEIQGALGTSQISNGSISDSGEMRFTVPLTLATTTEEAVFEGTVTGSSMRGTISIVGQQPGTFVGTRPDGAGRGGARNPR